jgi:hypothetical protein
MDVDGSQCEDGIVAMIILHATGICDTILTIIVIHKKWSPFMKREIYENR